LVESMLVVEDGGLFDGTFPNLQEFVSLPGQSRTAFSVRCVLIALVTRIPRRSAVSNTSCSVTDRSTKMNDNSLLIFSAKIRTEYNVRAQQSSLRGELTVRTIQITTAAISTSQSAPFTVCCCSLVTTIMDRRRSHDGLVAADADDELGDGARLFKLAATKTPHNSMAGSFSGSMRMLLDEAVAFEDHTRSIGGRLGGHFESVRTPPGTPLFGKDGAAPSERTSLLPKGRFAPPALIVWIFPALTCAAGAYQYVVFSINLFSCFSPAFLF